MVELIFPPKTINLMKREGISEADITDVYKSGSYEKTPQGSYKMWKKYSSTGYEISFLYVVDKFSGKNIVTFVRKRERR